MGSTWKHAGEDGEIVLWTNHPLAAARRIYGAAGFRLVGEEPHPSFSQDLVGQHLALGLGRRK